LTMTSDIPGMPSSLRRFSSFSSIAESRAGTSEAACAAWPPVGTAGTAGAAAVWAYPNCGKEMVNIEINRRKEIRDFENDLFIGFSVKKVSRCNTGKEVKKFYDS